MRYARDLAEGKVQDIAHLVSPLEENRIPLCVLEGIAKLFMAARPSAPALIR
jgi:hypothetical protein